MDGADGPVLRTARLALRPLVAEDVPALLSHWGHPDVARWLWDGGPVEVAAVRSLLEDSTGTFRAHGWGLWALRLAGTEPLVGVCGLRPFASAAGSEVELLYSLDADRWGAGYATEAATAVVAYGLETLRLPRIIASLDDGNDASVRVLVRLGFEPVEPVTTGGRTYPCFAKAGTTP
jgi:[ribosomal protein S5]-alanine N-acetyltransferase